MRKNLLALLAVVVVIVGVYLWMEANRTFRWDPTYRNDSDEPFDCQLFDSLASATMPNGYTYWQQSFDSLMHLPGRKSLLVINQNWQWDSLDYHRVDSFIKAGNKVLLVLSSALPQLSEYQISTSYDSSDKNTLAMSLKGHLPPDTLDWVGSDAMTVTVNQGLYSSWIKKGYNERFEVTAYLRSNSLWGQEGEKEWRIIGHDEQADTVIWEWQTSRDTVTSAYSGKMPTGTSGNQNLKNARYALRVPIALAGKVGKGWLYVSSTPLFFTNYGALDPHISKYLNRQLGQLADYPTYRIDSKRLLHLRATGNYENESTPSPLSYMLSRPPLRWALYTLLAAVVLFMLFTARRRQRVIPVHQAPVNRNLEFVKLLGSIYHRRHENIDLLRKKYTYFKDDVRRRMMIDLEDERSEKQNAHVLAMRASLDEDEVAGLLRNLRGIVSLTAGDISGEDLRSYIDQIEYISKHL